MTASAEALQLLALLPDAGKYSEKLQELISKTEAANTAIANLKLQEKSSADRLAAAEALLGSLTAQASAIEAKNAADTAKIEAAEADLSRRETELESAKQRHADEVKAQLQTFAAREAELTAKQVAADADFATRTQTLHVAQGALRSRHLELRKLVDEARVAVVAA